MAFPPNYRQERSSRDKAKQQKAMEKQAKRDEKKAANRKPDASAEDQQPHAATDSKD